MSRYSVQKHWRKPDGDWVGVVGPIPEEYDLWFYIVDHDENADNWSDQPIAITQEYEMCRAACELLNKIDTVTNHGEE